MDPRETTENIVGEPPFPVKANRHLFTASFEKLTHLASQATRQSLKNSEVPTYRIAIQQHSAEALGSVFFFHLTACAFAGELYGVEAFNQPGVEESKKLLRQSLA